MSSRRKGSNESKDMWLKVNQKSLMKFEGVFTRFSGHFGMSYHRTLVPQLEQHLKLPTYLPVFGLQFFSYIPYS